MATPKNLIIANWKMNLVAAEARELASKLVQKYNYLKKSEVWIAPPFINIPAVSQVTSGSRIRLGAQNVHWEEFGAYTGEISVPMLKEFGVEFAIAGHSERRHIFDESDELVAQRARVALRGSFDVILCIGETLEQRESGDTLEVLESQLAPVFEVISSEEAAAMVIAYEPVWAIGTGKVAAPEEIAKAHAAVQKIWKDAAAFPCPPIVYGGSVSPDNFEKIIALPSVSGALVGGASLIFEKFRDIVAIAEAS